MQCYDPGMTTALDKRKGVLPGRFAYLRGLYAENYHRLTRLFAPQDLQPGAPHFFGRRRARRSARHHRTTPRYTIELHLTYCMTDQEAGSPVAVGMAARVLVYALIRWGAAHCHPSKRLWKDLGPFPPANTVFQQRMRRATFLNRWMEYLAEQGHSKGTLVAAPGRVLPNCA